MSMLQMACRRCERRGRLRIERLIAEHGAGVLDLRAIIAADCPRTRNPAASIYDRCGVCTTLLLARDQSNNGYIVGTLTLALFKIPTGIRAWIEDVIVDECARGKGVGEALTHEALRMAAAYGAITRGRQSTVSPSRVSTPRY